MIIKRFKAKVINGKLTLRRLSLWNTNLQNFEGKEVEVCIKKWRDKRTNQQNKYYWGAIIPLLAENFGYENEEMHEALKFKFLSKGHTTLPTVISTTKLDTADFFEYIEKIKRWATIEYQIVLPEPEDLWQD